MTRRASPRRCWRCIPEAPPFIGLYVHDVTAVGEERAGYVARALTELPDSGARIVLIAAFDAGRIAARIAHLLPPGAEVVTLDEVKLPDALLTNRARYLDKLNFATNFVFFRDADGLSTRLVSANYWAGYGGGAIRLWLRLFDAAGTALATWEQEIPAGPADFRSTAAWCASASTCRRSPASCSCTRSARSGHDVVKYALDTYAADATSNWGASLSCTHDANAWPSDRYAGLPAPREDERVILWLQNSHATPIPAGAVALDRMGAERPVGADAGGGTVRHRRRGCGAGAARSALAGADRGAGRAACGAAALRGDARRARAHRACQRRARRSEAGSGDRASARAVGARLSAAVPGAAARTLPQHRAADADGGVAEDVAAPARRVR